jgi:hypothetical protein
VSGPIKEDFEMSPRHVAAQKDLEFVALLQEFLAAASGLSALFDGLGGEPLSFARVAHVVGDDEGSALYRLKQRSHALFRSESLVSASVRQEALFDLTVGSLFHEALKLRETLYQREVYLPRLASLREASGDEEDAILGEFERLLARSGGRLDESVSEVRILLAQTREQFRRLLVERAGSEGVTRALLGRRDEVDHVFAEGFEGLLEAMHGDLVSGLVKAAHGLLESAYFVEAARTLREAASRSEEPRAEIMQLQHFSEGMQNFLEGDYSASLTELEAWVDLGGHIEEPGLAKRAAAGLGRVGRLVENDDGSAAVVDLAKQIQLRLESGLA